MYKVFVNNKPVFFLSERELPVAPAVAEQIIPFGGSQSLREILHVAHADNSVNTIYLIARSVDEAFHHFLSLFKIIHAAGGIVVNESSQLLVIYRKCHWDLPKGKIENDESPQEGAMREVCEETGICNLSISDFAEETWHTYYQNNTAIMKHTTWYKMHAAGNIGFKLQAEEGIEKAKWMGQEEVKEILPGAYPSIASLIQNHFLSHQ